MPQSAGYPITSLRGNVTDALNERLSDSAIPKCAECGITWLPTDEERWPAYLTDDEPPELAFYCPDCAQREFGDD